MPRARDESTWELVQLHEGIVGTARMSLGMAVTEGRLGGGDVPHHRVGGHRHRGNSRVGKAVR